MSYILLCAASFLLDVCSPLSDGFLNLLTFDVMRSVVFFYIKTPLRVKEAGLEELILTTWWPTYFDKEVRGANEHECLSSEKLRLIFLMMNNRGKTRRQTRAQTSD